MICQLLRPYIDLGPSPNGPLFAQGIEHYWEAFTDPSRPRFALQRTLAAPFRSLALSEIGKDAYDADDPREVPKSLRSERWQALVDAIDAWSDLQRQTQPRLILLMHALCFYRAIVELLPPLDPADDLADPEAADLIYRRESAAYVLNAPTRAADHVDAEMSVFHHLATTPHTVAFVGFDSAIKLLTHVAKTKGPTAEVVHWRDRAVFYMDMMARDTREFDLTLAESRFFRAEAFIPQLNGDRDAVVAIMDRAEEKANALIPQTKADDILKLENLHPLLESRAKEALWLGDTDLALERAIAVTELDPFEARGWLELGQIHLVRNAFEEAAEAYCTAALIGPPASTIARHMAGICYLESGKTAAAALMLKSTLDMDPLAYSTRDQILRLTDMPVHKELKRWTVQTAQL